MNNTMTSEDYFEDFAFFSDAQYVILFTIGIISCLLSVLGSSVIIYLVLYGQKTGELYHRLVLGLSLSDLFMTCTLMFQPILVRKETGYTLAVGNASTCRFVGFGYLFFITSYTYNCMLGIYFLAVVRYETSSKRISRFLEPWGHLLAFAMPIAIGVIAIVYDMLNVNPFLGACMLFPTDHTCTWENGVECENRSAHDILNSILDFYALAMAVVGLICTVAVWVTVRRRFQRRQKTTTNLAGQFRTEEEQETQIRRIRSISRQAVWYAVAYLVGLLCVVVANVVDSIYLEDSLADLGESPMFFITQLLLWLFFPLQGFFNGLVYIRPRLVKWKSYYKNESWFFAFEQVLSLETPPKWGRSAEAESDLNTSVRSLKRFSKPGSKGGSGQSDRRSRAVKGKLSVSGNDMMNSDDLYWANDANETRLEGFPGTFDDGHPRRAEPLRQVMEGSDDTNEASTIADGPEASDQIPSNEDSLQYEWDNKKHSRTRILSLSSDGSHME